MLVGFSSSVLQTHALAYIPRVNLRTGKVQNNFFEYALGGIGTQATDL